MAEAIGERDSLELLPITVWSHWVTSSRHSILPENQSTINFSMAERWAAVGSETAVCWKQPLLTLLTSHTRSVSLAGLCLRRDRML